MPAQALAMRCDARIDWFATLASLIIAYYVRIMRIFFSLGVFLLAPIVIIFFNGEEKELT